MAYRLTGPHWLPERQVREIFDATARKLAAWRDAAQIGRVQALPGAYRYRTVEIERLANTPGPAADRARQQFNRQFVRRFTEPGDVASTPEGSSRAASR